MIRNIRVKPDTITGSEEVVIVALHRGTRTPSGAAARLDRLSRGAVREALSSRRFDGGIRDTFLIPLRAAKSPDHILLLGLGKRDEVDTEAIADAGGSAARALSRRRFKSACLLIDSGKNAAAFVHAFVKGFSLALYQFRITAKPETPSPLKRLTILVDSKHLRAVKEAARAAHVVAEHAEVVRDLVNAPANTLTPSVLAKKARALSSENGVSCRVLGAAEMKKEKMGAILAVARGSVEEPKLVVMHYNKGKKLPQVCLVGKGVTFDSGGISIKPWMNMNEMKGDMAGGGLVTAVMSAAARLKLPLEIIGIMPCVENMPDGDALKPGDVVTTYAGKTIEVLSTDAEGRLILADAITYARKHYAPEVLVDFATLTGAVMVALGTRIAGVMGNSQEHIDTMIEAGLEVGEPTWQLPLDRHFYKAVEGDITDYKNYSGRNGSTTTAAALLGRFAGDKPWIHVDIAGTFWSDGGGPSYHTKGATGYGVDLAIRFLEKIARRG